MWPCQINNGTNFLSLPNTSVRQGRYWFKKVSSAFVEKMITECWILNTVYAHLQIKKKHLSKLRAKIVTHMYRQFWKKIGMRSDFLNFCVSLSLFEFLVKVWNITRNLILHFLVRLLDSYWMLSCGALGLLYGRCWTRQV